VVTEVFKMGRKILNISLPEELYAAVDDLAAEENKSKAELAREILREYITKRERWALLRSWGEQTVQVYKLADTNEVENIIHDFRDPD
jgi:metal-responsive CopG/Arc/MetJ family transcriptional regulator